MSDDTSILKAQIVIDIVKDCLYNDDEVRDVPEGEVPPGAVVVEGILNTYAFHPERLEQWRPQVRHMLSELPEAFFIPSDDHPGGGGGMSFLQACVDRNDHQWGEHADMERLFCLGMGLNLVICLLPREYWSKLPGGMPYYVVTL